jgi:hypothetical protein
MTTQVPPGPENAVALHDHPPATGLAPISPAGYQQPASAPPSDVYPAVSYPQEGAAGYPVPVPYPQPTAYPTAPPWATDQPAAAATGRPGAGQPLPQYGGLLVPYPDEMHHASRAQAPPVWPVAVFTLLFSVLGVFSARRRAAQARHTRNSTAPYWIAFVVTAVAGAFVWFVVGAVVIGPVLTDVRENQRLEAVQRNVVGDGQLRDARIEVTAAQCRAVSDRSAEGLRDYLCRLTLAGGKSGSLALTADESGQWRSGSGR